MFQKKIAYGAIGCPFTCPHYDGEVDYSPGLCPATEAAAKAVITHELMRPPMSPDDLDIVVAAFYKVLEALPALKIYAERKQDGES